jgi:hypothetical protein
VWDRQTLNREDGDFVTKAKKAAIHGTLNNVKSFLQKLLKVNPMTNSSALNDAVIHGQQNRLFRDCRSSSLGSEWHSGSCPCSNFSPIDHHAMEGIAILDAANIAAMASFDETADDPNYVEILTQESSPFLGFSVRLLNSWIGSRAGIP